MSISRQNLTVVIVSFKSDHVIHQCIKSIDKEIKVIVVENSNDTAFKLDLENKYKNVECVLSKDNIGMGAGNNLGLEHVKTDFVFILNPDVILDNSTINEVIVASENIESFSILAPISDNLKYLNYKLNKNEKHNFDPINPFQVKSVDGFAMLLNLKKIKQLKDFSFFDENFFLYLENDDLCKRLKKHNENIYIIPKSKINHLGGKTVDPKYKDEIELSRNWHWMWSKFYYNKKHYGYFNAFLKILNNLISGLIKFFYYFITFNNYKKNIYQMRLAGLFNSMIGNSSWYRPKLKK
jgi:GT2 family glycosyltransferase